MLNFVQSVFALPSTLRVGCTSLKVRREEVTSLSKAALADPRLLVPRKTGLLVIKWRLSCSKALTSLWTLDFLLTVSSPDRGQQSASATSSLEWKFPVLLLLSFGVAQALLEYKAARSDGGTVPLGY